METLIREIHFKIMGINNVRGDLIDTAVKKEALVLRVPVADVYRLAISGIFFGDEICNQDSGKGRASLSGQH